MNTIGDLRVRRHGRAGPTVIALHGGPAAVGSAAALARGMSGAFTVIEPWQRTYGGGEPLTVARHVADLHDLIQRLLVEPPPVLIGESWGAMLALAYAAEYPHIAGPIVLVGCGTFDKRSREIGAKIRAERIDRYITEHPQHAADLMLSLNDRIMKWHRMTDNYDPLPAEPQTDKESFDLKAHTETWEDMLRCQEIGRYPQAFSAIDSPVLMLHGAYDPHPGKMIRDNLKSYMPQLEYVELEKCGHSPATEIWAKEKFFATMQAWLKKTQPLT